MKFVMILIQLLLILNFLNAQAISNSIFIESNQNREDEYNRKMKDNYIKSIQKNLQLNELIQNLKKADLKTPNKLILEAIQNILKQNNILKIREYKRNETPQDIQAIALYDYLKDLNKKLEYFYSIIKQSQEFFQGFEVSIKNLIEILQKIEESLKKIQQDKTLGNKQENDGKQVIGQNKNKHFIQHLSKKKQVSKQSALVQLNTISMWEYKETQPIQDKDCPNQLKKLSDEYIFFLKVQETLLFISQQQQIEPIQQKLIPFQNVFQVNGKIVIDFIKSLNLKNLDKDTQEYIERLRKIYRNDDQFFKQIKEFDQQTSQTLKLISTAQPVLDFGDQLIRQILNLFDKINAIKENYAYQPDQVYKQLLQLDRDYKICKGSENYEIIKDIKIPKNNVKQIADQNYIIPPINSDQCQRKVHDIDENLLDYIKNKILSKIENIYKIFVADDFHQTFMFGPNPGTWKDRIRRFQEYNLQYFDEKFQRKLVKLAEYQSNYKPDDPQSVAAYERLQILNNKIWQISNFFDQAKSFIVIQKERIKIKDKFEELIKALKMPSQKELDTTVSNYVLDQEVIEQLRDYKICTGKDFYESHNIVHIYQRFIKQQNEKSNLVIIEERKQINDQVLQQEPKQIKKSRKSQKSQKAIKQLSSKKSEPVSYIQVQGDWKYYDYPPILKNECQEELNIIKEDILQFKKIQVLYQYQKSHQKNYNKIIEDFLSFEDLFIENIRFIKLKMEWYGFESNIISFDNIPKGKSQSNPTELAFNSLLQFNKYLTDINDSYLKAKSLLNLNRDDFSVIRFNQYVLNEYLDKQFKYQPDDVEKELKQLYRDYQICTGRQYETEKADAQKPKGQEIEEQNEQQEQKMINMINMKNIIFIKNEFYVQNKTTYRFNQYIIYYLKQMNIMIMILIFYVKGFEYKERPPIQMRTCKWPKIRERSYDQVIKEEIISFSRLSFLRQVQSNFQQNENILTSLEGLSKVKEQSAIINSELVDKVLEYKPEELVQYKSNKDPDDPLVIECYDKILDIEKKITKIKNLLEDIGGLYSQQFLDKIQSQKQKLKEIQTQLASFDNYSTKDIQLELNQLNRDYNICFQETYPLIKVFQQDKISLLKNEVISPFKLSKTSKKKNLKKKNQQTIALQMEQKWEYKEYKPVQKSECTSHKIDIEEDYLQFLKIQEIFKFKQQLNNQNNIVSQLNNFKDKYIQNNKIILEQLKNVQIRLSSMIQFPFEYDFSNPDSKQIQQIYNSYEKYQLELNIMSKQIQSAFELSLFLNENLIKDIKNSNDWINNYLNNRFTYQQDDVYKELLQINRDYQICGRGVEQYDLFISHNYKLNGKTVESQKEPLSSKLGYNERYNCQIELDITKHAILRDYQHLDLLKVYEIQSNLYGLMRSIRDETKPYEIIQSVVQKFDLRFFPVEFKSYQDNYKPDDILAIQAYERLQLINDRLTTFKNKYNGALKYLTYAQNNIKQLNQNFNKFTDELNKLTDTETYVKSYLKKNLEDYTKCTDKDFNEEYQIQKDQQLYNKKQTNYMTSQIEIQEKPNISIQDEKHSQIFMVQQGQQQQWKYEDYEPILQSECQDELQEIKEDILQFQKIQTLFYYKKNLQYQYNILIAKFLDIEIDFIENANKLLDEFQRYDFSKLIQLYKYPDRATQSQGPRGAYSSLYKVYESLFYIRNEYGKLYELVKFNKVDFSAIRYSNQLLNEYLQEQFLYNEKEVEMELKQLYRDYEICTKKKYQNESEEQKKINRDPVVLTQKIQRKQKNQKGNIVRKNIQKNKKQAK
ncbi:hypothetical protein pb186bvf_014661 [Paramecium bursaria]